MTVKELIAHLQTFDENARLVVPFFDEYGDPYDITDIKISDVELRGKYVIFFDPMSCTEEDIDEALEV